MRVQRAGQLNNVPVALLDDFGQPIADVNDFLRWLCLRDYSPHTASAYAYDLQHFYRFLAQECLSITDFTPVRAIDFLQYLRSVPSHRPSPVDGDAHHRDLVPRLSPATVNRILAAVASFYEYLIVVGRYPANDNPIQQQPLPAQPPLTDRHRAFLHGIGRQRPIRRVLRVKTVVRLPRPMPRDQIQRLLDSFRHLRDKAMVLLILHGGLRPGEVLNLQLSDVEYGKHRLTIRHRTDHPAGVRTKSRVERVVDLHDSDTLQTVSAYVLHERPADATTSFIFLVGGNGKRRYEPLSYHALVKLFQRHCTQLGIRSPWVTPHALRHTHATEMWEGGMRELTLQKRLGHVSPESTRIYTRVTDALVVAEYNRALGKEASS